jgi:hypothetical protein
MLAAAEAFTNSLAPPLKAKGKTFRFVLLGGMFSCRDASKSLWFLHNARMIKVCDFDILIVADMLDAGRSREWCTRTSREGRK